VPVDNSAEEATIVSSSPREAESNPPGPSSQSPAETIAAAYQPPGAYVPPGSPPGGQPRRRIWPWILLLLAVLIFIVVGLGIAAAFYFQPFQEMSANTNSNVSRVENYNSNSNNSNSNSASIDENNGENNDGEDGTAPPTDEAKVLADLTDLEHEWTVANINADKKKLERILADDYVGTSGEGKTQGKVEYLRTIERDTAIQKWEFEDLKASLKGDRASLTGIIRLQVQDQPVAYHFTDKFVWRDGRWQATASEVTPIK
jgi:hypothetical protein